MTLYFKQATLDNGLVVVGEIDAAAPTAAMGFFVKAGARDEATPEMGTSHFLEHMMFKGTDRRTAGQVDEHFDDIGAVHNAFTTSEMTAFYAHALPEHIMEAESILSDILRPALRDDDFNDEKNVILEEIAMYDDQPFWVLYERAMECYYGAHPLSHRILGTKDTISALTCDQMRAYFNHRYSADNTVVALAGQIDFDQMVDRLRRDCGHWPRTNAVRMHPAFAPTPEAFTIELPTVNMHYQLYIAPAPAIDDERRHAAAMLAQILGDSEGSRLYWALVDTGLAEEAIAQYEARDGLGELLMFTACDPARADEAEEIVRREVRSLADSITEDDAMRVRNKVLTAATLHGERPSGRMNRLGRIMTYFDEYRSLDEELARMDAVTLDDLRAVAEAFPPEPVVVGRLRPSS
jgi:predicted Zn-dependent peptidase